jgi:hypothetical protein
MNKPFDNLRITSYGITPNPDEIDDYEKPDENLKKMFEYCVKSILDNKKNFDKELKDLIEKHPGTPQFMNYLSTYYRNLHNLEMAYEVNQELVNKHPDYLYGKVNLAHQYLSEGRAEEVPKILGEYMELGELYPERKTFHVDEVMSFAFAAVRYFAAIGNVEQTKTRVDLMKKVSPDSTATREAQDELKYLKLKKALDATTERIKNQITPEHIQKSVHPQRKTMPVFANEEVEELYKYGFVINPEILKKILSLPRESLISDLRKVLADSYERYDYFRDDLKFETSTHSFPLHAMLLLTELKAEEALDEVLEILRQDNKFLEFWFAGLITELPSYAIELLGSKELDKLKSYMFEEGNDTFARSEVSKGVANIAWNSPERMDEVVDWFEDVLNYFYENRENDKLIDSTLIGFFVWEVMELRAAGLEPIVKKLYESQFVDLGIVGDFNQFRKNLGKRIKRDTLVQFNLDKIYDDLAYDEKEYEKNGKRKASIVDEEDSEDIAYAKPVPEIFRNIGRNEKCPCGSGLKYKKCHGKQYN